LQAAGCAGGVFQSCGDLVHVRPNVATSAAASRAFSDVVAANEAHFDFGAAVGVTRTKLLPPA